MLLFIFVKYKVISSRNERIRHQRVEYLRIVIWTLQITN